MIQLVILSSICMHDLCLTSMRAVFTVFYAQKTKIMDCCCYIHRSTPLYGPIQWLNYDAQFQWLNFDAQSPVGLAQWESRRLSEICSGIWGPGFEPGLRQKFAEGYSPKLLSQPPVTLVFQMIFPSEEWNISHLRNRQWITKKKITNAAILTIHC